MTFENEDVVEKVCEIHFHEINNKMVSGGSSLTPRVMQKPEVLMCVLSGNRWSARRLSPRR